MHVITAKLVLRGSGERESTDVGPRFRGDDDVCGFG